MAIADTAIASVPIASSPPGIATGTDISEAVVALDTISSRADMAAALVEAGAAADTISSQAALSALLAESAHATDTISSEHFYRKWYVSFANVVPPPAGEGSGNPGVLKGAYGLFPVPPTRNNRRNINNR